MKIKIYIVTYKNPPDLNRNLKSIFESDWRDYDVSINVINNHSDFHLDSKYEKKSKYNSQFFTSRLEHRSPSKKLESSNYKWI